MLLAIHSIPYVIRYLFGEPMVMLALLLSAVIPSEAALTASDYRQDLALSLSLFLSLLLSFCLYHHSLCNSISSYYHLRLAHPIWLNASVIRLSALPLLWGLSRSPRHCSGKWFPTKLCGTCRLHAGSNYPSAYKLMTKIHVILTVVYIYIYIYIHFNCSFFFYMD